MANDIDWNSELTPEEQKALGSDECGQMELSRFYQKLIANVIIQQKKLNEFKQLCSKHKDFVCGGITAVTSTKTDAGTNLYFKHDGKESTITIPKGKDYTSTAPGITEMTVAKTTDNNVYTIKYGSTNTTYTAKKGPQGDQGKADDGTEYYDNGAVKRKNSVTGISFSAPGLVSASVTGLNTSANAVLVSLFGFDVSFILLFNASAFFFGRFAGTTIKCGAYENKAGAEGGMGD